MPRLLLLRHAPAERARPGAPDHERPLSDPGRADAAAIGETMAERGERPDVVLCSTSQRTRQTWGLLHPELPQAPEPRFLRELYDGGNYLAVLQRDGGDAASLLLIGHNPTIHELAMLLADSSEAADGAPLRRGFPQPHWLS